MTYWDSEILRYWDSETLRNWDTKYFFQGWYFASVWKMLGKWSSRQGKALGNYCSLECHGMTKALGFWLLCGSMTTSIHFFFPGVLRANVSSSWEVLTFQIYSTLFNLGVVLSGILSAQILAASVTPFVSKSHIQTHSMRVAINWKNPKPSFFQDFFVFFVYPC